MTISLKRILRNTAAIAIIGLYTVAGQAQLTDRFTPEFAAQTDVMTRETYRAFTLGLPYEQVSLTFKPCHRGQPTPLYQSVSRRSSDAELILLAISVQSRSWLIRPRCGTLPRNSLNTDLGVLPRSIRVRRRARRTDGVGR